jgi:hypothetical protein
MNIKLKTNNEKQTALIKAMGSRDEDTSRDAVKIFASLVGEVVQTVLPELNIIDSFYEDLVVGEFDQRTIALDDYHDINSPDYVRVSYSSKPGDLATSMVTGMDDFPLQFFNIQSAVSLAKRYLRSGQINHAEKAINKMLNEVVYKMKTQAIQPILNSVAASQTNDNYHVIRSETANQLVLKDFNRLKTLMARIVTSGLGGTTSANRNLTDLLMSPEMVEEIRGIAYEPMNTRGVPNSDESTAIAAPNSVRESVYAAGGIPTIYGTNIIELNEMGSGYEFNVLFKAFAGSTAYGDHGEAVGTSSTTAFTEASEEIILGVNRNGSYARGLVKASIADSETGATFQVRPDTQFMAREDKSGFFGTAELSYASVEPRSLAALIV